jgi:SAM-dependent methyltransferase
MAHAQQLKFVSLASEFLASRAGLKVLEVGSHDVNGSIRKIFEGTDYLGVDLTPGPGVDCVASGHQLEFPDETFGLTISSECFEHNPFWVETFANMYRMTAASGLVVVTCASRGRPEHGTTRTTPNRSPGTQTIGWDYYRNLNRSDFERNFDLSAMFERFEFFYIPVSQDLYFVGWKKEAPNDRELDKFVSSVNDIKNMSNSSTPTRHFFASVERRLLSPLTFLDDPVYQNLMIPYWRLRKRLYSWMVKN